MGKLDFKRLVSTLHQGLIPRPGTLEGLASAPHVKRTIKRVLRITPDLIQYNNAATD